MRHRLAGPDAWQPPTRLSVLVLVAGVGTICTGLLWVFGLERDLPYISLPSVHVGLGRLLAGLVIIHVRMRYISPKHVDFAPGRDAAQWCLTLVT